MIVELDHHTHTLTLTHSLTHFPHSSLITHHSLTPPGFTAHTSSGSTLQEDLHCTALFRHVLSERHSFTHSLAHSLLHSWQCSDSLQSAAHHPSAEPPPLPPSATPTPSLAHSPTPSLVHSHTPSHTHSLTPTLAHSLTHTHTPTHHHVNYPKNSGPYPTSSPSLALPPRRYSSTHSLMT